MSRLSVNTWRASGTWLLSLLIAVALAGCGGGYNSIGGTISGLSAGNSVTLEDNGSDPLTLSANGSFTFATTVLAGNSYDVTVSAQPAGQTCSVAGGAGTVSATSIDVTSVAVTCVYSASLIGTVTGLHPGTSVTFQNGSTLAVATGNGGFAFPGVLAGGTAYDVTITVQPSGQTCTIANPTGTIATSVTSIVTVTCV